MCAEPIPVTFIPAGCLCCTVDTVKIENHFSCITQIFSTGTTIIFIATATIICGTITALISISTVIAASVTVDSQFSTNILRTIALQAHILHDAKDHQTNCSAEVKRSHGVYRNSYLARVSQVRRIIGSGRAESMESAHAHLAHERA